MQKAFICSGSINLPVAKKWFSKRCKRYSSMLSRLLIWREESLLAAATMEPTHSKTNLKWDPYLSLVMRATSLSIDLVISKQHTHCSRSRNRSNSQKVIKNSSSSKYPLHRHHSKRTSKIRPCTRQDYASDLRQKEAVPMDPNATLHMASLNCVAERQVMHQINSSISKIKAMIASMLIQTEISCSKQSCARSLWRTSFVNMAPSVILVSDSMCLMVDFMLTCLPIKLMERKSSRQDHQRGKKQRPLQIVVPLLLSIAFHDTRIMRMRQ